MNYQQQPTRFDALEKATTADGSAKEVETHLRLLTGASAVDNQPAATVFQLFDNVRAMTWRLLNPNL